MSDSRDARSARAGQPGAVPVSVIMPIWNEERYLAQSVSHVLSQEYPGDLEVILAVGPSRDATQRIADELSASDPRVVVVGNPSGQIASALNLAVKASRFPVIVRVDGHSMLPPGYIATVVRTLEETGAANVGGVMAAAGTTAFQRAVAWAMTSPFGVGAARFHIGGKPGPADTVYMGAFRREAIERAGGYDEAFLIAEDWELNHRIRQQGGLVWFLPSLRVTYRPRASVPALARQYFRYGRWRRVVARQHAGTISLRYLAPPLTLAAIGAGLLAGIAGLVLLLAGIAGVIGPALLAGFAVPALYVAGVLAVSVAAARDLPLASLSCLPVALATMHVSWGAGFLSSPRRLLPAPSAASR